MPADHFLIDTSVWLFALRREPIPEIKIRIDSLLKEDLVITTGIIELEILTGARTEKEYKRLKSRLNALDHVETDDDIWRNACENGFRLKRKGLTIPSTDVLIATCALHEDAVLLHGDAHFDLIAKPLGLKVESHVRLIQKS